MRRKLLPLVAVVASGFVAFGTGEGVLACEPGSETDGYVRYDDRMAMLPPIDVEALAALTAELEGRVVIRSGENASPVSVESVEGHDYTPLLAALALAAPLFTAASVGIFALRNRRR